MLSHIQSINHLIGLMPTPTGGEDLILNVVDQDLQVLLCNSGSKAQKDKQVKENIRSTSLTGQSLYSVTLQFIEPHSQDQQ